MTLPDQTTIETPQISPRKNIIVSIETTDVMFGVGLLFLFVGLSLALGVGWAFAVVGAILTGVSLWMIAPLPAVKEQD
jgi:lysylphosphatidylglycerol synthetase-like protein (DUF2156 family)